MGEKGSKWLWGCSIILLVMLAIVVLALFGVRWYVSRMVEKDMSPEEIAAMERFFNEPVGIPQTWQEVEPYPDALVEAVVDLCNQRQPAGEFPQWFDSWEAPVDKLQRGDTLAEEEWEDIGQMLETHQDFLSAVAALVDLPAYELQAFSLAEPVDAGSPLYAIPDFLMVQRTVKLLCLQAYAQGHRGEWGPAFESALTALRLTKRHPASILITHLIAIACEGRAVDCLSGLAARCDDPAILRSALEEMNRLDPLVNLDNLDQAVLIDPIGALREFKRQGLEVDLSSGKPAAYYSRQHLKIAQGASGDPSIDKVPAFALGMTEKVLYKIATPNALEAQTRERTAKAKFDLARLVLARRLEQLENNTAPQDASQFVPDYFAVELRDPFVEAAYPWDTKGETFYSIGPDENNDSNRIRYDPTNGTISVGDISLF